MINEVKEGLTDCFFNYKLLVFALASKEANYRQKALCFLKGAIQSNYELIYAVGPALMRMNYNVAQTEA